MTEEQTVPQTPETKDSVNENTGQVLSQSSGNLFLKKFPPKISFFILLAFSLGIVALMFTKSTTSPVDLTGIRPENTVQPLTLNLESPADETIVVSDRITVKGKTLPKTTVVFYTDSDANSIESDASGYFEGTINLSSGINTLTVEAFADNGEEKSISLDIVYDS